jgi:outer membrane protein OmpA-like peptidoglycan-associated protein
MHRRRTLTLLSALPLALAGCAGGPITRTPSSGAPASGGWFGSGLSPALEAQRARLREALRGTPVVVEATGERQLRVAVPTRHAFDAGRSAVKPALAAVLDQFAIGFKPFAATTELRIAVPADDKPSPQVVKDRGASARDYLVGRGVPRSRIGPADRPAEGALEIVVSDIGARP